MDRTEWLSDVEIRLCSVISVVSFILFGVATNLFLYPLTIYYFTPTTPADCRVASVSASYKTPCDINSCADSCTSDEVPCLEYTAAVANATLPLVAGLFNCGLNVNCTYFKNFVTVNKTFKCEIFTFDGQYVVTPKTSIDFLLYLGLTSLPLAVLAICTLYVGYRKLVTRAYPQKKGNKKVKPQDPKSFYQRKLLELERLKKEREERERIARYNDSVQVENLNTVTALVFKPSSSWMEPKLEVSHSETSPITN